MKENLIFEIEYFCFVVVFIYLSIYRCSIRAKYTAHYKFSTIQSIRYAIESNRLESKSNIIKQNKIKQQKVQFTDYLRILQKMFIYNK